MSGRIPGAIIYLFFALLALALFYTQVIRYPYYHRLAENNAIRIIPIEGPRGTILDRNNIPLVANRLSFDVACVYQELEDRGKLIAFLVQALGVPRESIEKALEAARRKPYAPVTIVADVDKEKAMMLEEMSVDIRGLVIETRSKRDYIYHESGAHVYGYLSEITEDELERLRGYGYRMRDLLGRGGIEKQCDTYLTGVDGGVQIEVDNRGRHVRTLGMKEPANGKDVQLTIDAALQVSADKLLGGRKGVVIAMDPRNGEILALASHPSFDPAVFIKPEASRERLSLLHDKIGRPLLNRAISGGYPPGSVFKIVVASAGLETKRISAQTRFFCGGSFSLGRARFNCWKEGGHGSQEVTDALMNSCNVFFYNTGKATGVDNIELFAKLFGYGKPTGIDLPEEVKGIVPGRLWKRLKRNDSWYEGDTINFAIGQGYLLVTPLQVVTMVSAIANGGYAVKPFLIRKIDSVDVAKVETKAVGLRAEVITKVREGLYKAVNGTGTAQRARVEGITVAAKTGTAQNPQGKTHAWFTGYAPYNDPRLALVIFLEHGGHGGVEPAQIAKGMFEEAKQRGYL